MFEATNEQQSKSSVIVVSNSAPTATSLIAAAANGPVAVAVDGAISALNEALVDAIDQNLHHINHHHHVGGSHINVLQASYYYCTNLLDFKSHFNQTITNLSSGYIMHPPTTTSATTTAAAGFPTQPSSITNNNDKSTTSTPLTNTANSTQALLTSTKQTLVNSNAEAYTTDKSDTTEAQPLSPLPDHGPTKKQSRSKLRNRILRHSKRLLNSSSVSHKPQNNKLTNLNRVKNLIFKTYRSLVNTSNQTSPSSLVGHRNNRLRYSRLSRHNNFKSSSLSPTSPSSSNSSSSSCSNSPDLTNQTPSQQQPMTTTSKPTSSFKASSTYKRFRKIRNQLLKCNVKELVNEDEPPLSSTDHSNHSNQLETPITNDCNEFEGNNNLYRSCQISQETVEAVNTETAVADSIEPGQSYTLATLPLSSSSSSASSSSATASSSSSPCSSASHYTNNQAQQSADQISYGSNQTFANNTEQHNYPQQQQQQSFVYDVEMLPSTQQTSFLLESAAEATNDEPHNPSSFAPNNNNSSPASFIGNSSSSAAQIDPSLIQQCQIKQDLLKLSYEKFKQFRLNEKLLQQTVLIRNAIKLLQYDIQFQQEQEQILLQQQMSQAHSQSSQHSQLHQQQQQHIGHTHGNA